MVAIAHGLRLGAGFLRQDGARTRREEWSEASGRSPPTLTPHRPGQRARGRPLPRMVPRSSQRFLLPEVPLPRLRQAEPPEKVFLNERSRAFRAGYSWLSFLQDTFVLQDSPQFPSQLSMLRLCL